MVTINLAYTAPINPPGTSPTLTPSQIWTGLQRKVRAAQEFVPLITSCTVLSESLTSPSSSSSSSFTSSGSTTTTTSSSPPEPSTGKDDDKDKDKDKDKNLTIVREVVFRSRPDQPVREECVHYAPSRVDFRQEDGSTISNVVSRDGRGQLMMTYVFEWRHPEVDADNDEEVEKLRESHSQTATMAVEGSINTIRRLVEEGEIQ